MSIFDIFTEMHLQSTADLIPNALQSWKRWREGFIDQFKEQPE